MLQTSVKLCTVMAVILTCFLLTVIQGYCATESTTIRNKKILVLHSYTIDYEWTRTLHQGMAKVFKGLDWSNVVRYEFLDTKNIKSDEYFESLAGILNTKYQLIKLDGIICTDNNAQLFLERYGKELFPDVPVIGTGINNAGRENNSPIVSTIIVEQADHLKTIRQALQMKPDAKSCYVISDTTTTGKAIQAEVRQAFDAFSNEINFQYIDHLSYEELLSFSSALDRKDIIYLLPYFKDVSGATFDQGHVATALAEVSSVPIFVSWDFQLNTGVIGGSVVSGEKYGELAAHLLLQKIEGKEVPPIVFPDGTLSTLLLDWGALKKFNLLSCELPAGTVLINQPVSFFSKHRSVIIPGLGVFMVFTLLLLLLLNNLNKQKLINVRNDEVISLNDEVIETQRELVTTLGEVIETRSKETGNHVKRVAKISRLLGEKIGLTAQELEILEAASPLHDVGKIGIPESILHYPGKLSEEDYLQIQDHTTIGRDLLEKSDRKLLSSACTIAYQHHERWDGSGYPRGLQGEEIHIFARITMLADIYDALSMDRCYKKAWPEEKVLEYITKEKGRFFDPHLVNLFIDSIDEVREIHTAYPS